MGDLALSRKWDERVTLQCRPEAQLMLGQQKGPQEKLSDGFVTLSEILTELAPPLIHSCTNTIERVLDTSISSKKSKKTK
jgi:hypothetical protein